MERANGWVGRVSLKYDLSRLRPDTRGHARGIGSDLQQARCWAVFCLYTVSVYLWCPYPRSSEGHSFTFDTADIPLSSQ